MLLKTRLAGVSFAPIGFARVDYGLHLIDFQNDFWNGCVSVWNGDPSFVFYLTSESANENENGNVNANENGFETVTWTMTASGTIEAWLKFDCVSESRHTLRHLDLLYLIN